MATINAASASSAHIQAAIDAAANGDTVLVPTAAQGSVVWTSNVTIPETKGISVIGAGAGSTYIDLGGAYGWRLITRPTNARVRLSGFSLSNASGGPSSGAICIGDFRIGATDWRVDHIDFNTPATMGTEFNVNGYTFGLVDHCNFTDQQYATWLDMGLNNAGETTDPASGTNPNFCGSYSWTQPIIYNGSYGGGPAAVYIEDCNFSQVAPRTIIHNMRRGSRVVFRHCTFNGAMNIETHSGCTHGGRNNRWFECYDNTWNVVGNTWAILQWRACNGYFYNNTVTAAAGFTGTPSGATLDCETVCLPCLGSSPFSLWEFIQRTTYPIQDQIGAGIDTGCFTAQSTTEAKTMWWNNPLNTTSQVQPRIDSCASWTGMIESDRDYFVANTSFSSNPSTGVGWGTLANRPSGSPLVPNRFYWATDTSTLYRSTSSTTWEEYYRPYTYPHPLQGSGPQDTLLALSSSSHTNLADSIILTTGGTSQNFTLTAVPTTRTIAQRDSATYVITSTPLGGYNRSIDLSVSGLPNGCTGTFDSSRISYNGQATLTIATTGMTSPTGTYTVVVTGTEVA